MPSTSFRDLKVWKESMLLVEDVYRVSRGFPADERFGLTSQIRRAAVSIPSNIGEGGRRKRRKAHLKLRLGYLKEPEYRRIVARVDEIGRMLNGLIDSLQLPEDESTNA